MQQNQTSSCDVQIGFNLPRIQFNWGFHDGTAEAERNALRDVGEFGNLIYAAGYKAGVKDYQKTGRRTELSNQAWLEFTKQVNEVPLMRIIDRRLNSLWEVSKIGGTAYYPLAIDVNQSRIISFHAFDAKRECKARSIVALHNIMLTGPYASEDIQTILHELPLGPWKVRERHGLYPMSVIAGDGATVVTFDDLSGDSDILAHYLVAIYAFALQFSFNKEGACEVLPINQPDRFRV